MIMFQGQGLLSKGLKSLGSVSRSDGNDEEVESKLEKESTTDPGDQNGNSDLIDQDGDIDMQDP